MTANLDALVLNADFRPISVFPLTRWSFEDTARAVYLGRVSVVSEYDRELRSVHDCYRPASVVALKAYVNLPDAVPFNRENIFLRDRFTCQYCGEVFRSKELTFDHVIPRRDGGKTSWDNIATACAACNSKKGHRRDIRPIRMPREPTQREMVKLQGLKPADFDRTQLDVLYWSGILERDE